MADEYNMSDVAVETDFAAQLVALTEQINREREARKKLEKENADLLKRLEAAANQTQKTPTSRLKTPIDPMQSLEYEDHFTDDDETDNVNPGESSGLVRNQSFHQPNTDQTRVSFLTGNRVSLDLEPQRTMTRPIRSVGVGSTVPAVGAAESIRPATGLQHVTPEPVHTTLGVGLSHAFNGGTSPMARAGVQQPNHGATVTTVPNHPEQITTPNPMPFASIGSYINLDGNLALKLAGMETMIQRIPRVPGPIKKSAASCYADSPFVDDIALVEMPPKFSFPNMKPFDGTSDPDDHIAQYRQRMFMVAIPRQSREACMCKGFGSSLIGSALQWYTNLPNNSISSFAQLTNMFVQQYASSRKLEKISEDLYVIVQRRGEPLRNYVGRFNKEKVSITNCNQQTATTAFRKGLLHDSDLYKKLTKYPCKTMEDVLAKAWAQIKWEEDQYNNQRYLPHKNPRRNTKSDRRSTDRRSEPYPPPQSFDSMRKDYGQTSKMRPR